MSTSSTRYRFAQFRVLVLSLCVLSVLCVKAFSQDFKSVHDGVEYAELTREISGKQVKMNLLRLDLKKVRLDVHHAADMAVGLETTSSIALRQGAFAAINAGFFRIDKSEYGGESAEALMIDRRLFSNSINRRVALGISNRDRSTEVKIGHVALFFGLSDDSLHITNRLFVNAEPIPGALMVYTTEFGSMTPKNEKRQNVIVRPASRDRNRSSIEIGAVGGNTIIPKDGFVISLEPESPVGIEILATLKKSKKLTGGPFFLVDDEEFVKHNPEDLIAGVPQLIKNSKIDITWEQEKASKSFVETRHPRTAVAKLKDGKFLMITVDGRSEDSAGIDLYDLAKLLLEFGATDAMNLDGGGSTTMFLDGKVVNKPSDPTGERKVGDAILVTLRKPKRN
ncbi:MAG: phosphodiester glycosidase family protein [Blastocatellia bacterium]|nr:phosphodiester glycosidase family protein [Blastocatellia bacterium]